MDLIVEQNREHTEIYYDKVTRLQSKYIALHVGLFWGIGVFIIKNEDSIKIELDEKIMYDHFTSNLKIEDEFKEKLLDTETTEQVFQDILTKYKFFLYPNAKSIQPQPELVGSIKRKPDYLIVVNDEKDIYIEIEPPNFKPFLEKKKSKRLEDAIKQVDDWKKIISEIPTKKLLQYLIIIGYNIDLNKEEIQSIYDFNSKQKDLKLVTWDYITDNISLVKSWIQ